jgi:uncharacterized protein YciI
MAPSQPRLKDIPKNLKPYFLALFRPAERWNQTEGAEDLPARQLGYLRAQFEAGVYRVAGPVTDGGEIAAMAVIEAASIDEARRIANEDPAVQNERLRVEVHPALLPALDAVRVEY